MKKIVALTLAVLMMAALAAGCNNNPATSPTGTSTAPQTSTQPSAADPDPTYVDVIWFHHFGEEGLRIWAETVADQYKEETGATMTIEVVSNDKYMQLLNTKVASDDAPNLLDLSSTELLQEYWDAGHLVDLTGQPYLDNIREECVKGGTLPSGEVVATQTAMHTHGVWYNKGALDSLGFTTAPLIRSEFMAMLQTIQDAGIAPVAAGWAEAWTVTATLQNMSHTMLLSTQPTWWDDVVAGTAKFAENAEFIRSLELFAELIPFTQDDPFGTDWNKACELVAAGNAAMTLNGPWTVEALESKNPDLVVGYMGVPISEDPTETRVTFGISGGFGVFNSPDEQLRTSGIKAHETLMSVDSLTRFQETAIQIGSAKGLDMSFEPAFVDLQAIIDDGRSVSYGGINTSYGVEKDAIYREQIVTFALDPAMGAQVAAESIDAAFAAV